MVTADDARKGLFTKLRKPQDVVEAPAIADDLAVDARNLALLFSVGKYPPPGYDMLPNTRDDFSYEGIVLALKNWQSILTFAPAGVVSNPVLPGNLYHCGYTATVYLVAEAVVDWYTAEKFAELAELHNQLTVYVTRDVGDKTAYVMPSLLIGLLRWIPLNTVWLKTHTECSNCPDVETNLYMSVAIQVTVHIFGVSLKPASITTYVMQHPIAFTQEMKDKDEFKAFALKWNASKNSMRALEFTERQKDMVPTHRPLEDYTTRMAFTVHGNFLPHITPTLDEIVPYDSQCDPAIVAPSWREMGTNVARLMKPHGSPLSEISPFMMPFLETNMALFQACVKGLKGSHYSTEFITRDEKMNGLLAPTIDRRVYQMMLGDISLPLDGKVPHWATVEVLICFMPRCCENVYVKGFTVVVNDNIFGTVDTSLAYQCPHKNCLVCVGCA